METTPTARTLVHFDRARIAEILLRIVDQRQKRIAEEGHPFDGLEGVKIEAADAAGAHDLLEENPFLGALRGAEAPAIIAEVKMGSPRIGSLAGRVDPVAQAKIYRDNGAAALSVVVEPDFFFGSYALLERCAKASGLPAIAKDFIVHPIQLRWARDAGAGAILLIAALYQADRLAELAARARSLGLVPLIETHDASDLEKLEGGSWELVGVNNRDLRTFDVDLGHSEELAPRLPPGALPVAESGISSAAEGRRLQAAGFRAFLIGESLLLADDPGSKLKALRL